LGVTIDGNVKRPNEIKQNEALEYPSPKSISELRRFLGLSGWFREFIKDYATLTEKLTECLKGKSKTLKWSDELERRFKNVKNALKNMKELGIPDYKREFVLKTDASN
jgi:hypothetical protein